MEVRSLGLPGLLLVAPRVFADPRGVFLESWQRARYAAAGIDCDFVQDNHSVSSRGTVRGLHYQAGQAKLLRVARGRIFDVAVDVRSGSPTFGRWVSQELDGVQHHQIFIPAGFAHGFQVLSEEAEVLYKISTPYDPTLEAGIRWNDRDLNVTWPIPDALVSARDQAAPSFAAFRPRPR